MPSDAVPTEAADQSANESSGASADAVPISNAEVLVKEPICRWTRATTIESVVEPLASTASMPTRFWRRACVFARCVKFKPCWTY